MRRVTGSTARAFSIKIFLPDGTADGLRLVEKSNWTGLGVVCPRAAYPDSKARDEFGRTGVYVLLGPSEEGDQPTVYVGQAEQIRTRVDQHHAKKDFWQLAVFFVTRDNSLNRAMGECLESRLVELARGSKRARLDNVQIPQPPNLSEADRADVESFLLDLLSILPLVGVTAFEKPKAPTQKREMFWIRAKGVEAKGYQTTDGFVVKSGSQGVVSDVPSIHGYMKAIRLELRENGVLAVEDDHLVFTQDYTFASPSTAAGVVLGRSANGRVEWKDRSGRTLKELQEAEAGEEGS
jgi:hypothetical protein